MLIARFFFAAWAVGLFFQLYWMSINQAHINIYMYTRLVRPRYVPRREDNSSDDEDDNNIKGFCL